MKLRPAINISLRHSLFDELLNIENTVTLETDLEKGKKEVPHITIVKPVNKKKSQENALF